MAISGSAFAQGLMKGVGGAAQTYFEDMRRERYDNRKLEKTFDMFKKQSDYSHAAQTKQMEDAAIFKMGLEDIATKNQKLDEWERVAQMDVKDIVYENATDTVKRMGLKGNQARKFIVDYMARKDGITKPAAMNDRGLTLPDYSQYQGQERFKGAIPVAHLAGIAEMPDADQVFQFTDKEYEAYTSRVEELTTQQKNREAGIKDFMQFVLTTDNYEIDYNSAAAIYDSVDKITTDKGLMSNNLNGLYTRMKASGEVMPLGRFIRIPTQYDDEQRKALGLEPLQPGGGITMKPYQTPGGEREQVKEERKVHSDIAKALVGKKGSPAATYKELTSAINLLDTMDEDALDYLFQAGYSTETFRDIAAKFGSDAAQQAKDLITEMSGTVNSIRHELFGSALTEGETAKFREQFADIGFFNNKDNLRKQLENLRDKAITGFTERVEQFDPDAVASFADKSTLYGPIYRASQGLTDEPAVSVAEPKVTEDASGVARMSINKRPADLSMGDWSAVSQVSNPVIRFSILAEKSEGFRRSYGMDTQAWMEVKQLPADVRAQALQGIMSGEWDINDLLNQYRESLETGVQAQ